MKLDKHKDRYIEPPGVLTQLLSHPYYGSRSTIEISIFNDHRYAFFFWNKWSRELNQSSQVSLPCLITFYWHQDLVYPCEKGTEKGVSLGASLTNSYNTRSGKSINPMDISTTSRNNYREGAGTHRRIIKI